MPPLSLPSLSTDRPATQANPKREYVSGYAGMYSLAVFDNLANHALSVVARHGDALYDAELLDADVRAAVNTVKAAILADGVQLTCAVRAEPADDAEDPDEDPAEVARETAEYERAEEIRDFCQRVLDGLEEPFETTLWKILDAIPYGAQLAEWTAKDGEGPDAGRLVIDSLRVKPRDSWNYAVNRAGKVVGYTITSIVDRKNLPTLLGPDKFVCFEWLPSAGAVGGTPALDAVYEPWNLKVLLRPERWTFLSLYAMPVVFGTTGEDAGDVEERDENGNPTGVTITPQEALLAALVDLYKKRAGAGPAGTEVHEIGGKADGRAFADAFAEIRLEIAEAITNQVREAARISNDRDSADAPSDDLSAVARVGKKMLAGVLRKWLQVVVRLNFGDEAARLTPIVRLGVVDLNFFSRVANAIARLASAGLIPPEAAPEALAFIGMEGVVRSMPRPKPEAPARAPQQGEDAA